jgi:PAS domain S-box-containing protein
VTFGQLPRTLNIYSEMLFEQLPDGLILLDETGQILLINPKGQEYLPLLSLSQSDNRLEHIGGHSISQMMANGSSQREFVSGADDVFLVSFQKVELVNHQNVWMLILQDITRRKQFEHEMENLVEERTGELHRAKERLETILNNSSDAVVLAYKDGTIRQTNLTFNQLFNAQPDDFFGKSLVNLFEPDQQETIMLALNEVAQTRHAQRIEVVARRGEDHFIADVAFAPIPDAHSGQVNLVCSLRDITSRKQIELELRKALEKERELNELKSSFISMTSHEFRTPLTTILSSAGLLEIGNERMTLEQRLKHIQKIQVAAKNMARLLDDFLYLGQAEAGKLKFQPQLLNLRELCLDILEELQISHNMGDQVQFSFTATDEQVLVDEKLLRHIIINLLSNAVKYSRNGKPIYFEVARENNLLKIRVQDQGIGIPEKDQQRLFEAFHRAGNVGTIQGTGLGLVITRKAVEAHNGTIEFTSQVNIGTTFHVTIPLQTALS